MTYSVFVGVKGGNVLLPGFTFGSPLMKTGNTVSWTGTQWPDGKEMKHTIDQHLGVAFLYHLYWKESERIRFDPLWYDRESFF